MSALGTISFAVLELLLWVQPLLLELLLLLLLTQVALVSGVTSFGGVGGKEKDGDVTMAETVGE